MDAVTLTRQLIDIESISGNEAAVGNYLYGELCRLGYETQKMPVEGNRFNVYATVPDHPQPTVAFSTHMDTVPPFITSSEDADRIYGRGSCDAKGIIAAQIAAAERLRREQIHIGLLFVVGEERDSLGAKVANDHAPASCKFLVNGEPTENHIALASKGTLRAEATARGRMAHSAYPELGDSAIDKLIAALARYRRAHGKSHRPRLEGNSPRRSHRQGTHGALGLSRTRRLRHRQTDRRSRPISASPRKITSPSPRRELSAPKPPPGDAWRTRPIPNSATPPSTN